MKHMRNDSFPKVSALVALIALGLAATPAPAANISWGTPKNIASDTDVVTNGTLIRAVDWSGNYQTVNGVSFVPANPNECIQGLNAVLVNNNTTTGYGVGLPSSPSLSTAYGNILNLAYLSTGTTGSGSYGYGTITVVMNGLTPGHQYEVQVWCEDPRLASTTQTITDVSGNSSNNTVTVALSTGAAGSSGQYVVGTFTADSPIAANGNQPAAQQGFIINTSGEYMEVNAVQLRDLTPGGTVLPPYFSPSTQTKNSGAIPVTNTLYGTQSVVITSETAGSTIYYTTDGTTPTTSSLHGTNGNGLATVVISTNTVIKAIGAMNGWTSSSVSSGTYNILPAPTNQMNGIQDWKQMKYGMMVTYAYNAPNNNGQNNNFETPMPDGSHIQDINTFANQFNAPQFASDLASFGLQYVIFTAWHGGECPLYPSAVMNSWRPGCCPTRDLLGDMIDACRAKGIKVIFYTHPLLGHNYSQVDDATTGYWPWNWVTWSNFKNDEYSEMIQRYGSRIDGFYTDDGFQAGNLDGAASAGAFYPINTLFTHDNLEDVDYVRLRSTIKASNTNMVTMCNGSYSFRGIYSFDYPNVEQGGLPSTTYSDGGNFCAQSIQIAPVWWATVANNGGWACTASANNIFRYTVLGAGTQNSFGGAAWAAGCYDSSGWEPGVAQTMQQVGAWMAPIGASIYNTYASSSYVTGAGNSVGSIANGIVATKSTNNAIEYIHVLNPPSGTTLSLPKPSDSKTFTSAQLLANGQPVTLVQNSSGVTLTLTGTNTWSSLDTVIALSVAGSAPTIFNAPVSQGVILNQTASLTVQAIGAGTLAYQWQAGPVGSGTFTNLVNGGQISGATTNVLTILNATTNNALDYRVIVSNSYGSVTSAPPATLTLLPTSPLVDVQFDGSYNFATSTATPGPVQTGPAILGAGGDQWNVESFPYYSSPGTVFSAVPLTNTDGTSIGATLTVSQPSNPVYTGTYPGSSYGAMDVGTTNLMSSGLETFNNTTYPGYINFSIGGLSPYANSLFTLVVYAGTHGAQTETITLTGGAAGGNTGSALTTSSASRQLSAGAGVAYNTFTGVLTGGTLTFQVAGGVPQNSRLLVNGFQLQLTTNAPPLIASQPVSQTVPIGGTAVFGVSATGSAPLSYQWQTNGGSGWGNLANGGQISGATSNLLTITNATVNWALAYQVIVTNNYGAVTSTPVATLTETAVPTPVAIPNFSFEAQSVTAGTYSVVTPTSWSVSGPSAGVVALIHPASGDGRFSTYPPPGLNGNNYCQVYSTGAGDNATVYQDLGSANKYQAGTTYTLTAAFGLENGTFPTGALVLYNSSLVAIASNVITSAMLTSGRFTNFSVTYTATGSEGGNGDIVVGFKTTGAGASTSFDFDNVSLTTVTPAVPPSITNEPVSQVVSPGTTVTLSVGASGTSPLSYQWKAGAVGSGSYSNLVNGASFSGATSNVLTIPNVTTSQTADYVVVVTNMYGAVTSAPPATLSVVYLPVITTQPVSQTNYVSTQVAFSVGAVGSAPLSYQWQAGSGGTYTNLVNGAAITGATSNVLTLLNATTNWALAYQVIITNGFGSVTSSLATLTLTSAPPTTIAIGNYSFEAQPVADGTYNNLGTAAPTSWSVSGPSAGVVALVNPGASDGRGYGASPAGLDGNNYCQIYSTGANDTGSIYQDTGVKYTAGTTYTLTGAFGLENNPFPTGTLNLYNSSGAVIASKTISSANLTLGSFKDFSVSYTATGGANEAGNGNYDILVGFAISGAASGSSFDFDNLRLVASPNSNPTITYSPPAKTAYPGGIISFSVVASESVPLALSYQWQAGAVGSGSFTNVTDGGQLTGTTGSVLTISNVTASSMLDYRVIVANNVGSVTSSVATLTVPSGWTMVWGDDFNGTTLDSTKWSAYIGNDTGGQNTYTSRTNNVYVANGLLHLVAQQDGYNGYTYSSAQVRTEFKYSKQYGHIEARMRMPAGQGFWPAFWMLGTNYDYPTPSSLNWPYCGEIDVPESPGGLTTLVQGTIHYADVNGNDTFQTLQYTLPNPVDTTTNFHTYGIQWTSNSIIWQVDGVNVQTWNSWGAASGPYVYPAPFNQPFFFLLQLAVSGAGDYGGPPNSSTPFPSEVQVDYVHVYDQVPVISLQPAGQGSFVLTWSGGNMLEATNLLGPWTTNTTATSPFTVTPSPGVQQKFYRVQSP
jgi:beta-glucanase (GH16 family)